MNPSPEGKSLSLNFDDARFTPRIGPIAETYPPYWHWPSPQSQVTVEIPYQVPEDIPTGVYRFTITGWHSTNHEGEGETEEFTITVGNGATRTETSRAVSETRKPTDDTATTATDICYDMIQFDELSDAAQTEFKTAMDDGGLVKPYHEFHITEEVKFVDNEIGRETCIQMGDNRYYAVDGCKRNDCKLKVVPAGTEFQGFNHDYHDGKPDRQHNHSDDAGIESITAVVHPVCSARDPRSLPVPPLRRWQGKYEPRPRTCDRRIAIKTAAERRVEKSDLDPLTFVSPVGTTRSDLILSDRNT